MQITLEAHRRLKQMVAMMQMERLPFWHLWRDLADNFLPKRYVWLQSDAEWARLKRQRNNKILDSTGTIAARILASGMMNGITSPARPWFFLRIPGFDDDGGPITQWCDEVTRRMMRVFSESNFYNSIAVLYLDLVIFGSASQLIYEDHKTTIRCYNPALGEFYFGQDYRLSVNTFAREFHQTVEQIQTRWGKENCSDTVNAAYLLGGGSRLKSFRITHLIEPNDDGMASVPKMFPYRETYWETGGPAGRVLAQRGFHEMPGIFPRWECTANDSYGTSPALDALPDVLQLQQETKRKAQGLDKMVSPPIIADLQLQHRPMALLPNGITYVSNLAQNDGAKPIHTVNLPLGDLSADIADVRTRIQEIFHNPLFNMISQLDTVRSATEIDARKEEKLVLLGSVLERFENEALDPAINRVYGIMSRAQMLPPPPPGLEGRGLEIQYVSILSTAQRAASAIPTERWIQLIGSIAGAVPAVLSIPNWDSLIRNYGLDIGVAARDIHTEDEVSQIDAQQQAAVQTQEAGATGRGLAESAATLSKADVGGGVNALQQLLGG